MAVSHVAPPQASLPAGEGPPAGLSQRPPAPAEKHGPGAALLLLLLPVACCGGPAIFAALAATSAATLGVAGGIIGAVLLAVAIGLFVRHRRSASCYAATPAPRAWRP